jgi:glycosyltransferase involved in cell wall biosynthesis
MQKLHGKGNFFHVSGILSLRYNLYFWKMRIGFDAKRAFFNRSGLGNYSRTLIGNLARMYPGDSFFLYSPSVKDQSLFKPGYGNIIMREPARNLERALPSLWRSFLMGDSIDNDRLDIYHGLSNELPHNIGKSKAKSVVTVHDLIFLRYPSLYRAVDRLVYRKKFAHACSTADAIIAISEQTKKDIVEFFGTDPGRIQVIYQSCSEGFLKHYDDSQLQQVREKYKLPPAFILCVGTVEERKNQLSLVKAIRQLGNRLFIPLVIVGKPTAYKRKIVEYIGHNGLEDKVLFYENISHEDLPLIYRMAALFVYPSLFEGFGIPVIEALYSGVPVITSTGSCFSEAGGPFSIYVDPQEPEEISNSIHKVLGDPELSERMRREGRIFVKRFDSENVTSRVYDLYKTLSPV